MDVSRRRTTDLRVEAGTHVVLTGPELRLLLANARRDGIRWLIASTLPSTSDDLFAELDEAEYRCREAQEAFDEHSARIAAHRN